MKTYIVETSLNPDRFHLCVMDIEHFKSKGRTNIELSFSKFFSFLNIKFDTVSKNE